MNHTAGVIVRRGVMEDVVRGENSQNFFSFYKFSPQL